MGAEKKGRLNTTFIPATRYLDYVPPQLYFVASAIFHYLGPAFAVILFGQISVEGVAWLRIVSAALVFAIWRRPWRIFKSVDKSAIYLMIGLGATFAFMNYSFYYAISKLPLGTVAAIEFIGPVLLAVIGTKNLRNFIALMFTSLGVWMLTDVRFEGTPEGFMWAFANAICFVVYIVLAHKLATLDSQTKSIDRLGISMIIASIFITPLGVGGALPAIDHVSLLMAGLGVGISSSVIPYLLDQLAMEKLSRATYSTFVALLPATAVIIGVLVLSQIPTWLEILAVCLIIVGVVTTKDK